MDVKSTLMLLVAVLITGCASHEDGRSTAAQTPYEDTGTADGVATEIGPDGRPQDVAPIPSGDWCPMVDGKCPSGCEPTYGRPYDATGSCLGENELVACSYGIDAATMAKCRIKSSSGTMYRFEQMAPTEPDVPGWTVCQSADIGKVTAVGVPSCTK